jgi:xanthine dehydrogenase small subunit
VTRSTISFMRRGRRIDVADVSPRTTLLEWLRLHERSTGTKEGCAEGDCGACTVVLAREKDGRLVYEPVNSCIFLLGQADGTEIITVEDLAQNGTLHPVQKAMVTHHGSQCGFCTPGIVMSLFALSHQHHSSLTREMIDEALAGNLCRCTGYRPIIDAAFEACVDTAPDHFDQRSLEILSQLAEFRSLEDVFVGDDAGFFAAPASESSLSFLLKKYPDATIIAGATDVGLWITKGLRPLDKLIWLGRVKALSHIEETDTTLSFGANITHQEAYSKLAALDPDFGVLASRFGSRQVRASGTVVGNIANASPIGDWPPAFLALNGRIELRQGFSTRIVALEDYFIAYKQQDRRPGEYLRRVIIDKPAKDDHIRIFKVSKRRDEDISSVMVAFRITVNDNIVVAARIAFGGMAGIPRRAVTVETTLAGKSIRDLETWRAGAEALSSDFTPLSDHRASADYRLRVARNLVIKALAEIAGVPSSTTRISGLRVESHAAE